MSDAPIHGLLRLFWAVGIAGAAVLLVLNGFGFALGAWLLGFAFSAIALFRRMEELRAGPALAPAR